ncbi:hypothetical protein Syun_009508 [Stephania yunnanensis]|uniref:Uncharacterized protein n=1 Tax=Stephania yunnanensis TaxID=152371 RepID=A0AAP0KGS7_9MAGN
MAGATHIPVLGSELKFEIPTLNGENYRVWKERILLHLGVMDIDFAIRKDEPQSNHRG